MQGLEYIPLSSKLKPKVRSSLTQENTYWRSFRNIVEVKLSGPVNHISICPIAPYHFAATSGTNVVLFSGETRQKVKSFSRFLDIAYSGNFRRDGKLLTAGDEKGNIKLFDVENKTMLRQIQPHSAAVHAVDFLSTTELVSGSDDKMICLYDIPTNMVVNTYKGHTDYVRSMSLGPVNSMNNDIFVSGGFDHCIKLWDKRIESDHAAVMTIATPHPVYCLFQLSQSILLAGCDKDIIVYDLLSDGKQLDVLSYHQKQVTSISYYMNEQYDKKRLLSSSLDTTVKVIDPVAFKPVHTFKFPAPVLSAAVSPDNIFAVGTTTGVLSTRVRVERKDVKKEEPKTTMLPGALIAEKPESMKRNHTAVEVTEVNVENKRAKKEAPWDRYLKKFEDMKALDSALATRKVTNIIPVLEELRTRGTLKIAIKGRDGPELEPLVSFIRYFIGDPAYTSLLTSVTHEILDIYGSTIGHNPGLDEQLLNLQRSLEYDLKNRGYEYSLLGMVNTILENAHN